MASERAEPRRSEAPHERNARLDRTSPSIAAFRAPPRASDRDLRAGTEAAPRVVACVAPPRYASLLRPKAQKKPATVIRPAKSCVSANASGIIVSTTIASTAPAATAVVAATTAGALPSNSV